ncbi:MAG: YbaK/EbsC family protein [Anaerolineales bacterium]|nr:YbaK/EbsC family protein [Anaerolineales bacterium]
MRMINKLSKNAQIIQETLHQKGLHCQVIEFSESTRTAQEAADRCNCQLEQIVKSLIFKGKKSGIPILVLTSGANRVDLKRLQAAIGEKTSRAEAEFVREVTGFSIGGVAPVGHPQPIVTYMDQDLLKFDTVWAAAGTPNAVFEVSPAELQRITNARPLQVTE